MRLALSIGTALVPVAAGVALAQGIAPPSAASQPVASPRAFKTADWYRLTWLSAATLSPDGSKVAVEVTTVNEGANKRHHEIWVVPTAGGDPVRFTSATTESENPSWSTDGKLLLFTSDRGAGVQHWAIHMDQPSGEASVFGNAPGRAGGGTGGPAGIAVFRSAVVADTPADKSFTVTTNPSGVPAATGGRGIVMGGGPGGRGGAMRTDSVVIFNDSTRGVVLTGSPSDLYARMSAMARPPATAITKPEDPARFDGMQIVDARFKANGVGFVPSTSGAARGGGGARIGGAGGRGPTVAPAATQIYLQRNDGTALKTLTHTAYSHRAVQVSPDGTWISFTADPALRPDSIVARDTVGDAARGGRGGGAAGASTAQMARGGGPMPPPEPDRNTADVFVLPVAACEAQSPDCKPRKIDSFGDAANVSWSPDSKYLTFIGRGGPSKDAHVMFATPAGGKAQEALVTWPFELANGLASTEWLRDNTLAVTATTGGSNGLYRVDPATRKVTPIVGGRRVVTSLQWDASHTHVVFIATDVTHPTELFIVNADGTGERQLTSFNDKLNAEIAWSPADRFTYTSVGGLDIEGWLMKPYGYEPGKKYPLVLYIHGGPHSAYDEGWFDEFQNLAGGGCWVLYTNPRGSSNYGTAFSNSTLGRWGAEDYRDLMKAVDIAAQRPDVDSTKMGVTGGSYGGFMTAWIETKTTRFKAAETDRMISEWTYWWGASDAQSLTNGEFFGRPWENQAMYDSLSPIRHVANVKTPTLLIQSEEDYRAPIGDAELWFEALKTLNVPAEFIRYPRSNHDLSRTGEPWLLVDRLSRIRQWFTYWLLQPH